jgi:iron(II)-dependent oxidoreductase
MPWMDGSPVAALAPREAQVVAALTEARERTLSLVAGLSDDDLERVHCTLMSPLAWDLGHIAAFEDLWICHRYGGRPLLREGLADIYDAFETPRPERGDLPFLRSGEAKVYLAEVRARATEVLGEQGLGDGLIPELVLRHEHQHNETMLQTIQLAQLLGVEVLDPPDATRQRRFDRAATGLEMIEVPAGPCTLGAGGWGESGFAYDNERPRHRTDVRGYLIGRTPVTNATYLTFVEGGGYERREWWSAEGWAWKEDYDITRPQGWAPDHRAQWRLSGPEPLRPDRPVVHISWFEADALARSLGCRLPTETEWEKAATWDQEAESARPWPWGTASPVPGVHANIDRVQGGPAAAEAHPDGASPVGCVGMIGDVWEWTASPFTGYPGFVADPYREYSAVFFGRDYKVLRGGSWATHPRVATPTFRNWDFPQRRQVFAGVRLARDL